MLLSMKHMACPVAVFSVALIPLLPSCASESMETLALSSCESTTECEGQSHCIFGHCVTEGANEIELSARILPPANTELLAQQVPSFKPETDPSIMVTLIEPVTIFGRVKNAGDAFTTNFPGEIEARAPGHLPGIDYHFQASSLDGLDADGIGYELRLLPGRTYEITFRPDSNDTPPHTFILAADDVVDGKLDIELPALTEYIPVVGHLRLGPTEPIPNARVTILLPLGRALPAVFTDSEKGIFETLIPPGSEEIRVRIEAPDEGPLFPDFTSDWLAPSEQMEINVPALTNDMLPFSATIQVNAPDVQHHLVPAVGLHLALSANFPGGILQRSATTDSSGQITLELLAGVYEVLVTVPPGLDYGSAQQTLELRAPLADASTHAWVVNLEDRFTFVGEVVDVQGTPVHMGTVSARRRSEATPEGNLWVGEAFFQTELDDLGRFELRLDPGTYDITIVPDPRTGAPPHYLPAVTVEADSEQFMSVGNPGLVHLTVLAPDQTILPDVTVELYNTASFHDTTSTPVAFVKGTTNEDGYVDLLVPFSP